jgi:hypothetical protein
VAQRSIVVIKTVRPRASPSYLQRHTLLRTSSLRSSQQSYVLRFAPRGQPGARSMPGTGRVAYAHVLRNVERTGACMLLNGLLAQARHSRPFYHGAAVDREKGWHHTGSHNDSSYQVLAL